MMFLPPFKVICLLFQISFGENKFIQKKNLICFRISKK